VENVTYVNYRKGEARMGEEWSLTKIRYPAKRIEEINEGVRQLIHSMLRLVDDLKLNDPQMERIVLMDITLQIISNLSQWMSDAIDRAQVELFKRRSKGGSD